MGEVIAICNQKGGVAKTTSAFHLGVALAEQGRRVLWVDMDPQGALSTWAAAGDGPEEPTELQGPTLAPPMQPPSTPSLYDGLLARATASALMVETPHGPWLVPADMELSLAELELVSHMAPERRLARLLAPVRDEFDLVLIDCQPSFGMLTQNALACADRVLIPVACEYLALRVVHLVLVAVQRVRIQSNSRLEVAGLLPTLYDGRTLHGRGVLEQLHRVYGARLLVFERPIPKTVRFAEAAQRRVPIWRIEPDHPGGSAYRAVAATLDAARVNRGQRTASRN